MTHNFSNAYSQEFEYFNRYSKSISVDLSSKKLAFRWQRSQVSVTCPNCGNRLSFYQQIQGNKLVCFVCRKVSLTQRNPSVAC